MWYSWAKNIKFQLQPSRSTNILSKQFTTFSDETWGLVLLSVEEYCLTGKIGKKRAIFSFWWDKAEENIAVVSGIYRYAARLSALTSEGSVTPFQVYSPRSCLTICLVEGEKSIGNFECLNLTWTTWNLDKHHIVKDSADVIVSWPWNNFILIIARLTVSTRYWQAVPYKCLNTSNMKVSTSSRMSSSVSKALSCDAWSIKSRKASRRFTPIDVNTTINIIFMTK